MKPVFIKQEVWESLTWKEQDYIIFRYIRGYSKTKMMRNLYITTNMGFNKLANRVKNKLKA